MVAFTYNQTTFKVTQVTETAASGSVRTYGFDYSVANRFRVTDSQAQVTDYFVDASGRLTSVAYPGAAATSYTVQSGDTLYSIASALWGDQAMWFLIAEANGITAATQLVPGQRLIIPNKVTNFHNTSGTFRVYDPGEAIGDTMPTLPNEPAPPPVAKKKGCGGFGAILLAIIAVVVAVVATAGTLALAAGQSFASGLATIGIGSAAAISGVGTLGFIAAGAVGGAVGSMVSQGIGVATGLQDSFSWKAVGLAAIGGGAGGAVGPGGLFGGKGLFGGIQSTVIKMALRGAASNVITQGIGVATGLQDKFDWAGVAAAGVGAGVAQAVNLPGPAGRATSNLAGGLAASAAESLITGQDFGDTLMANLPGIIANTVGNILTESIAKHGAEANPKSSRFAGKSVDEIAELRIQDAARASGNSSTFLSEIGSNADLRAVFLREAKIIAAASGYRLTVESD